MQTDEPLYDALTIRPATMIDRELVRQWAIPANGEAWVALSFDGQPIGYAELQSFPVLQQFVPKIWVRPDMQGRGIGTRLLRALEIHPGTLLAQVWEHEKAAQRMLEKAGYELSSIFQVRELDLNGPPTLAEPIPDIDIRPFVVGWDEQAVYEADEEAFLDERGKEPRTYEQWCRRFHMNEPHFNASLWLVAWEHLTIAGCCLGEIVNNVGEIMHLGVRRPWRRRGIGMQLLQHTLSAFYQRGISTVRLNVDSNSQTNAHQLFEKAGFQVINSYLNYKRTVLA
ncbi:mycothiol synthase [Thermosporothrix hazakensis]|jgi:mycothiol synthase|uniref:Mycothiol synthase n=2 Tax=Thermosporothrix TaxID=768650 RepID=A0A326U7K2_THEHA|nr:GNAT family N-acetyltransferase [Thermosporothrix hazakensis]PZW31068.1 mycothiol synthase [Thermosporothrix hazakensis]BBH86715.1 hypothetical protein KTC_14660 [Thermosporothrix sp. COM3]GCE51018.1 hypothetical protein KTH_58870 [Thermosporothrix hazakensis]